MKCHICEGETEWTCRDCDEPVCEECCVPFTLQNQIDYTKCKVCHEGHEAARWLAAAAREEEAEEVAKKKAELNAIRKANYWKPENVEKRRIAKIERKKQEQERIENMVKEAVGIVRSMFRGM